MIPVASQTFHEPISDDVRLSGYLADWARSHMIFRPPITVALPNNPPTTLQPAQASEAPQDAEEYGDREHGWRVSVRGPRNRAIDTIVFDDLPERERSAVLYTYRIRRVLGERPDLLPWLLASARANITAGLKRRDLW